MNPLHPVIVAYLPEILLVGGGLLTLALGAGRKTAPARATATLIACGAALAAAILLLSASETSVAGLARAFLALLAIPAYGVAHSAAPRPHYAEQVALLLFSTTGMMLLAGANDLLTLFIALELAGLPLVALTALGTTAREPAGAALKLFLIGALASALMLFGISLVYGAVGDLSFAAIARASGSDRLSGPLFLTGTLLLLGGIAFKLAAAPLHLWAPDVYQRGSLPAAAWIAAGSKVAGFAALIRLLWLTGDAFHPHATPALACFGIASLVIGNLAALPQRDPRRMLAYSAVGQAGYVLVALAWGGPAALGPALFHTGLYGTATLAAFAAIAAAEPGGGPSGLSRRSPGTALALLISLITLAGLPPLPGFLGKFLLFGAMLSDSAPPGLASFAPWVVALAAGLSAVSLYYYLMPLKRAWLGATEDPATAAPANRLSTTAALVLALVLLAVGLAPGALLEVAQAALGQTMSMQSP